MNAHLGRLPQMRDELKDLRQRIKELEDTTNKNQQDKSK
jgi:BMFP domain-containing protein YqiC